MLSRLVNFLIKMALERPYRKGHIYHTDGSLYMGRYALFETKYLSARVHHIATEDKDVVMHDHPWWFVSIVLRGAYTEQRPTNIDPCFYGASKEDSHTTVRFSGSMSFRRPTDRHLIDSVEVDTWTLFIYGPIRQWWGFFTPKGKIYWKDFSDRSRG